MRALLAPLSPGHRRWKRFLADLPLDPDTLPRPLPAPGPDDFIICGPPRSGTTLLAAALFQPPHVVTVMEPWDGMRLPPAELFASLRQEIVDTGTLRRGRLDLEALARDGAVKWCPEGSQRPRLDVESDFKLGVKWPAYWRYLDLLPNTKFLVCVRDPVEVISSFKRQRGRLRLGLQYETAFNKRLNDDLRRRTRSRRLRRILLLETIARSIAPQVDRSRVMTVRYDRWFSEPDRLLAEIGAFLALDLRQNPARVSSSRFAVSLTSAEEQMVREYARTADFLASKVGPSAPVNADSQR